MDEQRRPPHGPQILGLVPRRAILDGVGGPRQAGAWVRKRMDTLKMSVKLASERSGLSRQTWYDLMADKHPPSVETQRGVAVALDLEPDWYDRLQAGKTPRPAKRPTLRAVTPPPVDDLRPVVEQLAQSIESLLLDAEARRTRIADFDAKLAAQQAEIALLASRLAALESRQGHRSAE